MVLLNFTWVNKVAASTTQDRIGFGQKVQPNLSPTHWLSSFLKHAGRDNQPIGLIITQKTSLKVIDLRMYPVLYYNPTKI
jgi:hypothetical protein